MPMSDAFREVAVAAARRAGAFLRAHRGGARAVSTKSSPINLVTEIDRGADHFQTAPDRSTLIVTVSGLPAMLITFIEPD